MGLVWLFLLAGATVLAAGTALLLRGLAHPPRLTYATALAHGLPADPADLELPAAEVHLRLADGSTSPGWVIPGERAQGPTLVVLHGFGDGRIGLLGRAGLWRRWASRVVLFDQRGHGDSSARRTEAGLREHEDVAAVLDQLGVGPGGAVLYGLSMGAGIALAAARRDPARVAGVIAESPYRYWDQPLGPVLRCGRYPRWPFVPLAGWVLAVRDPGIRRYDRATDAGGVGGPVLVLHGGDDPICAPGPAREIAEAAGDGRFELFEGAGHVDLAEADPSRYVAALDAFFQRLAEPRGRAPAATPSPDTMQTTPTETPG